jgi:diguanylate cyclase (GGDEF)-like protein
MGLVLIVHGEKSIQEELSSALSDVGCAAFAAGTAEEGLALVDGTPFPVALVGLDLPGTGGIDFLKKAKRRRPEMEVIIVPRHAMLETAVSSLRAGACDYLPAPFGNPDRVTAAVAGAVDKGRAARDRKAQLDGLVRENEALRASNQFLAEQVKRDGLTGLYNHSYFQEVLTRETARAGRYKRIFSLLFADLDHFKQYNDFQGHQAGDKALAMIAEILRNSVRTSDFIARYGGEEFVILLPETPRDKARFVAERVRGGIEGHPFPGRETQPGGALTVSIGLASFPEDGLSTVELIRRADAALYTAKRGGGNAYRLAG